MTSIKFEPVVFDTLGSIWGIRAYVDEMERTLPIAEKKERERLSELARKLNWDYEAYSEEQSDADSKWEYWIPRVLSYSLVTLLHSVVETQLLALSKRLRPDEQPFKVDDLRGRPIKQSRTYLSRVVKLDVASDHEWERLRDLAKIRNIIVHRGGLVGADEKQREQVNKLVKKYSPRLKIDIGYLEVSLALCRQFLDAIEAFFRRIFKIAGLSERALIED